MNFAVRKFPGYGKLSGKSIDELRAGERVAVAEGKDDPLDFVLWKAAKTQRTGGRTIRQPLWPGPPGLAHRVLGDELRPARRARSTSTAAAWTCSSRTTRTRSRRARAHSASRSCATGCTTAFSTSTTRRCPSRWATSSPSATCSQRYDGETLRFFMLRTHYRSPFNFSDAHLDDARAALTPAVHGAASRCRRAEAALDWAQPQAAAFRAAMNDDFNTPAALAVLFELAGEAEPHARRRADRADQAPGRDAGRPAAGTARATCKAARRSTRRRSRRASPRARRRRRRVTSRRPTASATSCSRKASCSRTRPRAPPGSRPERLAQRTMPRAAAARRARLLGRRLPPPRQARPGDAQADPEVRRGAAAKPRRRLHHAGALDRRPADLGEGRAVGVGQVRRSRSAGRRPASRRLRCSRSTPRALRDAGLSAAQVRVPARPGAPLRRRPRARASSGRRWTTKPSSTSWWPSAASAAGRPRCS